MARGALFFDLDGTLTDPHEGIVGCIRHALRRLECLVPPDPELDCCIGPPLRESFCRLAGEARADAAVEHYRERFREAGISRGVGAEGLGVQRAQVIEDIRLQPGHLGSTAALPHQIPVRGSKKGHGDDGRSSYA